MLKLLTNLNGTLPRFVRHCSRHQFPTVLLQCLTGRTLIRVAGSSASDYLQGLVTNDMNHILSGAPCMFAMFLNTKGRVLYDTIIYKAKESNTYLVECDYQVASDLALHLKMYKVRRKISLDVCHDLSLYAVSEELMAGQVMRPSIGAELCQINLINQSLAVPDPRVNALGFRVVLPKCQELKVHLQKLGFKVKECDWYRPVRHRLGVGEGVEELPCGQSFPLEANCDFLHGVSFHKGCYIGQELTARTYHTGVIRKRLMPLLFPAAVSLTPDTVVLANGNDKTLGKIRAISGQQGIGLLRVDEVLREEWLRVGGQRCRTERPFWWPTEAPKERPF